MLLWLMAAGTMFLGACSEDETSEAFSSLGVEQDKQNIENEGLALINDLRDLSNTKFAVTGIEMVKMLDDQPQVARNDFFSSIVGLGSAMGNEADVDQQIDVLKSLAYNEGGIFSSMWNEGKGIWEWNSVINDFVRTSYEGDEIIYKFPSQATSEINNATIRLYGLKVYTGVFPGSGESLGDGPVIDEMIQELYFSMHVDEELVATSNIINYFSPDGRFDDIAITFNPLPFSFTAELGRNDNKARWHYKVTNGENVILEHLLQVLAKEDLSDDYPFENIETNFRVKGVEIVGLVDGEKLFPVISEIEDVTESGQVLSALEEQAQMDRLASAINENADFKLKYVDGGVVAKAYAQAVFKEDTYSYYDSQLGIEVEKTESYWDIGLQFEFSDGSRISVETFFEQNFDRFTEELEQFFREMETRMS